jgi:hypothetical protein
MTENESSGKELAKGAGLVAGHVLAIVAGLVLMIAGLAMGVTLVLLPIGIPVGLIGLGVFLWGLFARSREKDVPG